MCHPPLTCHSPEMLPPPPPLVISPSTDVTPPHTHTTIAATSTKSLVCISSPTSLLMSVGSCGAVWGEAQSDFRRDQLFSRTSSVRQTAQQQQQNEEGAASQCLIKCVGTTFTTTEEEEKKKKRTRALISVEAAHLSKLVWLVPIFSTSCSSEHNGGGGTIIDKGRHVCQFPRQGVCELSIGVVPQGGGVPPPPPLYTLTSTTMMMAWWLR